MVTTVLVITLYDGLNSKYYNLQFPTKEPKAMSLYRFYFEKGILAPSYLFSRPKLRDLEGIIANATHDLNEVIEKLYSLLVLLWPWEFYQRTDLAVPFTKLNLVWWYVD